MAPSSDSNENESKQKTLFGSKYCTVISIVCFLVITTTTILLIVLRPKSGSTKAVTDTDEVATDEVVTNVDTDVDTLNTDTGNSEPSPFTQCLHSGEFIYDNTGLKKDMPCCEGLVTTIDSWAICAKKRYVEAGGLRRESNGDYNGPCADGLVVQKQQDGSEVCVVPVPTGLDTTIKTINHYINATPPNANTTRENNAIKVATFNMFWWSQYGKQVWRQGVIDKLNNTDFDIIGLQECDNVKAVLDDTDRYKHYGHVEQLGGHATNIVWDPRRFTCLDAKRGVVTEDTKAQHYGVRVCTAVLLRDKLNQNLEFVFANVHGATPTETGGTVGTGGFLLNIHNVITKTRSNSDVPAILVGDFNVTTNSMRDKSFTKMYNHVADSLKLGGKMPFDHIFSHGFLKYKDVQKSNEVSSDHSLISASFHI